MWAKDLHEIFSETNNTEQGASSDNDESSSKEIESDFKGSSELYSYEESDKNSAELIDDPFFYGSRINIRQRFKSRMKKARSHR